MAIDVRFEENGGEYHGWLRLTGPIVSVSFNPAMPCGLTVNGLRVEMDERITQIDIDGVTHTLAEDWAIGEAQDARVSTK